MTIDIAFEFLKILVDEKARSQKSFTGEKSKRRNCLDYTELDLKEAMAETQ